MKNQIKEIKYFLELIKYMLFSDIFINYIEES